MKHLNCYLIDDEKHAIALLTDFVGQTTGLMLSGSSTDPLAALGDLGSIAAPDIIFLDIDMPALSGLELAALAPASAMIVFTTSYREYGPEAFERNAADYLLKPISYERFLKCIQKIRYRLADERSLPPSADFFFIKDSIQGKMVKLYFYEVIRAEGFSNYIELHLQDRRILAYLSLNELAEQLPVRHFSRIHRSHIVNHDFIRSIEPGQVRLQDHIDLPIGRSYQVAFRDKMSAHFLISKRAEH